MQLQRTSPELSRLQTSDKVGEYLLYLHVLGSDPLRLVDEGSFLTLRQNLPLRAQSLGNLRIVHFRIFLNEKNERSISIIDLYY